MKLLAGTPLERLFTLLSPHRGKLVLAVACMIATSGLTALTAYLIKPALDDIFVEKNLAMLQVIPLVFVAVAFLNCCCEWASEYHLKAIGHRVVASLRQRLYDHIQDLPLSFFDRASTGMLMSRITNDVNEVQTAVTKGLSGLVRDSFSVVGLTFIVFYQNWKLAIIAMLVLPLAYVPLFRFGSSLRRLAKREQEAMGDLGVTLHETLSGSRIVKAFGMEEYEKRRFAARNQQVLRYCLKSTRIDALSSPLMELLGSLGIAAVIGYGGYEVINGHSTPGTFFSFVMGVLMLYKPLKSLSKVNSTLQKGVASIMRVDAILNERNSLTEKPGARELPAVTRAIELRHVTFAYEDKTVLHDVNLRVGAGEVIALVGSSGGGKTTLVNLIPRFYDVSSGAVLIDGVDIRDVTIASLRRQIAVVTQSSFLFNDTVRNNIAYGNPGTGDKDVLLAAKAAYAHDFVLQLPRGFDTVVGEQGVMLSGGQRQRICIARALLKDAPILILDEATSSLDSESELEVQMALENLMKGRTTFIIAHRLSTVQSADRIIVIADGRIMEEGGHSFLLSRKGEYRRLFDLQFARSSS